MDRRNLLLAVMCCGMFLVQLDVTVVNVALPDIGRDLGVRLDALQWVVDAYTVALAGLLLAGGALGDRVGQRTMVPVGLALFGVASLACGLAPGAGLLVAARALQGIAAALLLPGTLAVIVRAFPDAAERTRAIGIWAGASALALPTGPLIGGGLVEALGWRSVFLINLPIVAVALLACLRLLGAETGDAARRLDGPGSALAALGLTALVLAVIEAGRGSVAVAVAGGAIALIAVVALVAWERRAAEPMLPPRLVATPAFAAANAVSGAMNLVGIGMIFVTTLYLQGVQGRGPLQAGLVLLVLFVPLSVLGPLAGRVAARHGAALPMTAGLAAGALGAVALLLTGTATDLRVLVPLGLLGVGMGLLTAPVVSVAVAAAGDERAGMAAGANNAMRQSGGAVGVALFGALVGEPAHSAAFVDGLHVVGVVAAVLWIGALVLTRLRLRAPRLQPE